MFFLRRPSPERIHQILRRSEGLPFSYPEVGRSRTGAAPGYPVNRHRTPLGEGRERFEDAVRAMRGWAMYDQGWTELLPRAAPTAPGSVVVAVVRHFGFWSVNPCRVVYAFEEMEEAERVGFAIGTLEGHGERGEERFTVELRSDGSVWFEVFSFAAAALPLTRLGGPLLGRLQRRFGKAAGAAVLAAARERERGG